MWSGRRDSNPRPSPWQGDALPTEPLPLGSCAHRVCFESRVGAESQIRTGDTAIFSRVLYQLSYLGPRTGPRPGLARFARSTRSILGTFWACQANPSPHLRGGRLACLRDLRRLRDGLTRGLPARCPAGGGTARLAGLRHAPEILTRLAGCVLRPRSDRKSPDRGIGLARNRA